MRDYLKFYIDGEWVDPARPKTLDVINPATEAVAGRISLGSTEDVGRAVKAARKAFRAWSQTSREDRIALLVRIMAVQIGNDTEYGLAAYVSGSDVARMRDVASRLRAGQVSLNGANGDMTVPFGGYKMSGNGREWGDYGFAEYLEIKAVTGYGAPQ